MIQIIYYAPCVGRDELLVMILGSYDELSHEFYRLILDRIYTLPTLNWKCLLNNAKPIIVGYLDF